MNSNFEHLHLHIVSRNIPKGRNAGGRPGIKTKPDLDSWAKRLTWFNCKSHAFFARKPIASPAVLNMKDAIAPTKPGNICPSLRPTSLRAPPNLLPKVVSPFFRFVAKKEITTLTDTTTAVRVKPCFLNIALILSLRDIRPSISSFSLSSSFI